MAVVAKSTTIPEKKVASVVWTPFNEADTEGTPENFARYRSVTIQVKGTFGSSTMHIRGSADGSSYQTLRDKSGSNALTFTAAGVKELNEIPRFIRPELISGSGASLTVYAQAHGA